MTFRHLDLTCFQPDSSRPTAGSPLLPACGAAGPVTFALEATTCPQCLARFEAAQAIGAVGLLPYGDMREVVSTQSSLWRVSGGDKAP